MARPFPRVKHRLSGLRRDRRGGTAIEYGLVMALIVLAMFGALSGMANVTIGMWGNVNTKVGNASRG